MDLCTQLCLKWINKDLLPSTGNSAQRRVPAWTAEESGGEWTHVYIRLGPFTVHLTIPTALIRYTPPQNKRCFLKNLSIL